MKRITNPFTYLILAAAAGLLIAGLLPGGVSPAGVLKFAADRFVSDGDFETDFTLTSFGTDPDDDLYLISLSGEIYKLLP